METSYKGEIPIPNTFGVWYNQYWVNATYTDAYCLCGTQESVTLWECNYIWCHVDNIPLLVRSFKDINSYMFCLMLRAHKTNKHQLWGVKTLEGKCAPGMSEELFIAQKHKDGETVMNSGAGGRRRLGEKKVPFSLIRGGKLISGRVWIN